MCPGLEGLAKATVGIKLRPLRAVFNLAIEDGIIRKDRNYPFGRRRYQIPASRNMKKALQMTDVQKIYQDRPECPIESKARDYWLFCYLANGMNPKDVAQLKYSQYTWFLKELKLNYQPGVVLN